MAMERTEGPWRWEYNAEYRSVHLVGGRPQYDLTVMDFTRWGMTGAGIRLRELSERGMNLLHKLHERPDWIAPFPGRVHHKHWCAAVIHPDMRLIEAAPDLLEALEELKSELILSDVDQDYIESHFRRCLNKAAAAIAKATGDRLGQLAAEASIAKAKGEQQ